MRDENIKIYFFEKKLYVCIDVIILLLGVLGCVIGFSNQGTWATISVSVGTSLIAGALIAFLDIWRIATNKEIFNEVDDLILKAGVSKIYKKRDLDEYDDLIENAVESIDITGYSLRAFIQSYKEVIIQKIKNNQGFKVRLVIVNPESEASKNREVIEIGEHKEIFLAAYGSIKNAFDKYSQNIEIKIVDVALSSMIFRIDDVMFVGPHFYKKDSKSSVTFKLNKGGWAFTAFQDEFNRMWNENNGIE